MELAKDCVRMCHVLKTVTEGKDGDDLNCPSSGQIEDLRRCVIRAQPSSLTITSDIRIVRHIECAVSERVNCPRDVREYHPGSTKERLVAWQTEIWEILRGPQPTGPAVSEQPQGELGRGGVLEVNGIKQHVVRPVGAEPPAPVPVVVRYCLPHPCCSLLTLCTL